MKIVFLSPSGQLGGAERILLDVLSSLKEKEPDWHLHLILGQDGPLVQEASNRNVSCYVYPFPSGFARLGDAPTFSREKGGNWISLLFRLIVSGPSTFLYARRLKTLLKQIQPDIIHANGLKMHVISAWIKVAPIVWHVHDYVSSRPLARKLLSHYASRCNAVVANSNSVVEDLKGVLKNSVPLYTLRNAVALERFSSHGDRVDMDQLAGMPSDSGFVRVGLIATFGLWKGHETFLRAMAQIPGNLNFRGYIIGGPVYQTEGSQWTLEELRVRVEQLGLANRIGFTGFVLQPSSVIRSLDIIVHASTQPEPFGLIIAESMACGRPVVVSQTGGAAELIEPGINALGYPSGDARALSNQIALLIENPDLRNKIGKAGRETAEKLFDRKRLAKEMIPVYERIRRGSN